MAMRKQRWKSRFGNSRVHHEATDKRELFNELSRDSQHIRNSRVCSDLYLSQKGKCNEETVNRVLRIDDGGLHWLHAGDSRGAGNNR